MGGKAIKESISICAFEDAFILEIIINQDTIFIFKQINCVVDQLKSFYVITL